MFVITADQVRSRTSPDAVEGALRIIDEVAAGRLALAAERTVGDELQTATDDARCALDLVLALTRTGEWSVGCGLGEADTAGATSVRAARGPAFIAARDAVQAAKKRPTRFALRASGEPGAARGSGRAGDSISAAGDTQSLVDLLLALRVRRTDEGWQVFDQLATGATQKAVAAALGISEQAVSQRARAAQVSLELDAVPALTRALASAERDGRAG